MARGSSRQVLPLYSWCAPNVDRTDGVEMGAALDALEAALVADGGYDVLVGFSQGTIISTLVTAAALKRGESPSWRGNVLVCASPGVFVLSISMAADEYPTLFKV